ncbi:MAG: N-acetylmuramoyl-L-alanine amidase [Acidobacteriota bacterium]|nr:N-acetylmuramoyl-L-alanine amidase [Acidobacteriota bacterium]
MPKFIKIFLAVAASLILFSGQVVLCLETGARTKEVPVIKVSVEDSSDLAMVKISGTDNLVYSLKKSSNSLIITFRALLGLKLEKIPFSSELIKSIDLAKSPEAYLLIIKTTSSDFSFTHSARKSPFEITINIKLNNETAVGETKPVEMAGSSLPIKQDGTEQPEMVQAAGQTSKDLAPGHPAQKGIRTIVIDPGHGGIESGAKGNYGSLEKDITLSVAKKLRDKIEGELKYRVVMTRDSDVVVALDRRAAVANNNKADLFISIHANGSRRTKARGSETYFLSLNATDEESRRLAYFENNSGELENRLGEQDFDELKLILWDMAQSAYLKQSSQLADLVQSQLNQLLNTQNRGIKQAPFKVLTGVASPAILVEIAFITNPEEEKKLQSEEFQTQVAEAIYRGLNEYFHLYEVP